MHFDTSNFAASYFAYFRNYLLSGYIFCFLDLLQLVVSVHSIGMLDRNYGCELMAKLPNAMCLCLALLLTQLHQANAAWAQDKLWIHPKIAPGVVRHVRLVVDDQVSGSCWTNSRDAFVKVRLVLEKIDVSVTEEEFSFYEVTTPFVVLKALGLRSGNSCAVHATFSVEYQAISEASRLNGVSAEVVHLPIMFSRSAIFTNGSSANRQLTTFFETSAEDLASEVLSGRRDPDVRAYLDAFTLTADGPLLISE